MAGYIGGKVAISSPQQIETKHTVTATASQTSITNVGYTVGAVHVYQNGVRLVDGTDYTATNGSTITLSTGATENDQIVIVSHGSFETGDVVSAASGGTFSAGVTVNGAVTATSLVVPDGSIPLVDLDIDGGTDIGAALVDADLMVVDDGAGGTNRKATMSRLATYMGTKIGGGLEFVASIDADNSFTTMSFTGFDSSKYDSYLFTINSLLPATDNVNLRARVSVDGGSNYLSASDSYYALGDPAAGAGDKSYIPIGYYSVGNTTADGGVQGYVNLMSPHTNVSTFITGDGAIGRTNGEFGTFSSDSYAFGKTKAATVVNAIQFFLSSGNMHTGSITMYGRVNS